MTAAENTFFMVMFGFGLAMGLVLLVYVLRQALGREGGEIGGWELRGARQRIAAIARTTLAEGMRAKAGAGFAALILIAIPVFYFTAEGDGTIKGKVQMFLSYSLAFSGFCLSLLTIFFSCRSLSIEIASRQIYGVVSKPIPRWQIVAGKWIGVMALNVLLAAVATGATYAGTLGILSGFKKQLRHELETYGGMTPEQAEQTVGALDNVKGIGQEGMESPVITAISQALGKTADQVAEMLHRLPEETRVNLRRFDELRRQVVVARTAGAVQIPDLSAEVQAQYNRIKEAGELPAGWSDAKILKQIRTVLTAQYCTIPPGPQYARQWRLKGPPPVKGKDVIMSLRFKLNAPGYIPPREVNGRMFEENTLLCVWVIGDPTKAYYGEYPDAYPINTFHELEIPSSLVEDDGTVVIGFVNLDPRRQDVGIELASRGLEVLYNVGPFELGLVQAALADLIPLACLAAFGVCASTFLSFPVGALIVLTLFLISSSMGFVADALAATHEYVGPNPTWDFEVRRLTVEVINWALAIGDLDPVGQLIEGRAVGWSALWTNCWKFVLLKGMAVFLLAVLVIRRKEMAAVTV
jgi:ABC-type transport system involved in multi-copper enzyme maturation permease subunit